MPMNLHLIKYLIILSEAKDLTPKENNELSDSSSPSAPQNDSLIDFFSSLLMC